MSLHIPRDIAVVGIAHKLPHDVEDDAGFWDILARAQNQSGRWPAGRMNSEAHHHPQQQQEENLLANPRSDGGHFIQQDPASFDAPFFGITAKEAASMDPVQRWTLEVAYRAFENAGIPLETLKGSRTAVLSATFTEDYMRMAAMDPDNVERTAATGCLASVIPNRVSYFFGMHGPSIHVDTACSSALSAFDMACKVLGSGDAEAALVTAANLILEPGMYHMFNNLQMLSPDNTCKAFDHRANGFGRGEGVLAFVLKPVSQAIRDGDTIRAVVRGVASNQDGHTPALSQPNPVAQEDLIRHVYSRAGLGLNKTRYVEAHGTGTPVGDPIEMKAIGNAFRQGRSAAEPLYVGSVKSNIGHLEGASGLAGILKAILILEKGIIPPNAVFEKLNPAIDAKHLRVEVPNRCIPWPSTGLRRVSINGFGFGGSNTHVILDDARHYLEERGLPGHHCTAALPGPCSDDNKVVPGTNGHTNGISPDGHVNGRSSTNGHSSDTNNTTQRLLVFSAFDEGTVKRTLERYTSWYQANSISSSNAKLNALAHTLAARRSHMRWRSFAVASSSHNFLSPAITTRVTSDEAAAAWVFTGQGAQYIDMGRGLADAFPVFKDTLAKVDAVYKTLGCSWSIHDEVGQQDNINKPAYSQPLSTAIQLGLVDLLRSFGLTPKAVVGHSSGEIAAAYATGALSLASACRVSYFRGLLASRLRGGSMISVNLMPDQVSDFLAKTQTDVGKSSAGVSIACINSPFNVTLSGPEPGIDAVKEQADRDNVFARKLNTGVAYHSAAMRDVADEYLALIGSDLESGETPTLNIPMMSTVTGKSIDPVGLVRAQYWVDNMVSPVMFASAVRALAGSEWGITDLIEVGPHPALKRYVQDSMGSGNMAQYCSALYRGTPATDKILELAGILFARGHTISLAEVNHAPKTDEEKASPFLVDCPPYPFDHSKTFWAESRISRDYRLRSSTRGGVLGQRVSDWNPMRPRWRNFLSVDTSPWIGDHVVGDATLFPAAGMVIMALEAVREVSSADQTIRGYFVRDAHFTSPIIVPKQWDDRVETMLCLTPVKGHSTWSDIALFVYDKDSHTWAQSFDAIVQVQYAVTTDLAASAVDDAVRAQHTDALKACSLPIDSQLLYSHAADHGLQYGDCFRLCEDVYREKTETRAVASVRSNVDRFQTSSIVHPAILDTVFHVLRSSAGMQNAANVPTQLENAWFASTGWQASGTSKVHWLAASTDKDPRQRAGAGEHGCAYALADDGTVLSRIEALTTAAISKSEEAQDEQKKLLYGLEWKPQLSLLSQQHLAETCKADTYTREEEIMLFEHRQRTAVLNMVAVRHVRSIPEEQRVNLNSTLQHQLDWLEQHVRSLPSAEVEKAASLTDLEFEAQLDSFAEAFPDWTLYSHVARSLPGIVAGEIDPLQVIFESDHAKTFYASLFHTVCGDGRLDRFMQLAAHETPSLRILEVGAGTGGMTTHVLNALKKREEQTGAMAFSKYMYTDISPVFFESAKAGWDEEGFGGRMAFKTLDMEQSISDQGFGEQTYDLLVAGSCIHATRWLDKTLQNLRRLLRPGGRLVLLEVTDPTDIATCFFATLASGWWLSQEEWRIENKSPLASEDSWDRILRENGFSGNDLVLRDTSEVKAHIVSVIVSTAVQTKEETLESTMIPRRVFVVDPQQSSQEEIASILSKSQDMVVPLDDNISSVIGTTDVVVSLLEVDQPLLTSIPEKRFIQLQSLIKQVTSLLWVTAPRDGAEDAQFPLYYIAHGFLRTVRAEIPHARIVSLAMEDVVGKQARSEYVEAVIGAAFGSSPNADLEYAVRSSLIHTARAIEDVEGNATLNSLLSPSIQDMVWKDGPGVELRLGTSGSLDTLQFEQDTSHRVELAPHEIEIEARAWGLARHDALLASGRLQGGQDPGGFGSDCAGTVTRVGPDCAEQGPQPGDAVVVLSRGCLRKFPRAHERCVVRMNDASFASAVATLQPVVTAYHALVDVARVIDGDKILIHEAASATGQMAVQIAKMKGAQVFVTLTASSDTREEREFLANSLGVPPGHLFSHAALAADIRQATEGHGIDVVVGEPVGDQRLASLQVLAPGGRFVNIGLGGLDGRNSFSDLALAGSLARNASFTAVDVLDLRPQVLERLLNEVMTLLGDGKISPPSPTRIFPVTEVANAFKATLDGAGRSRVVVVPRPTDVVPKLLLGNGNQEPWSFDENATYLVPGGLGGIGRSILAWMAARGAKHLVTPSRSGASSAAAKELVSSLRTQGVNIVTPKCNISNEGELAALLDYIKQSMPAIKGVINCAMVLTNAVFVNMAFEQWSGAIEAKVAGSFNLHRLLSQDHKSDMDFFVHLASLAGVNGQMASANYTAGCTFQDALAQCYPGTTVLDVGWMADIGLIAETTAYQRQLRDWGNMQMVKEKELLEVLGMVCGGDADQRKCVGQQVLIGLLTPADYLAKGKEPPSGLVGRPLLSAFEQPLRRNGPESSTGATGGAAATSVIDHGALFRAAADDKARASVVSTAMAEKLARAMMMSADNVDPDRTLSAYGVDSLMAVELRNWLLREFGAVLGMWEMMSSDRSIRGIAEAVMQKSSILNA